MCDKYVIIQKPKRLKTETLHRKKVYQHLRKKYRHQVLGGQEFEKKNQLISSLNIILCSSKMLNSLFKVMYNDNI